MSSTSASSDSNTSSNPSIVNATKVTRRGEVIGEGIILEGTVQEWDLTVPLPTEDFIVEVAVFEPEEVEMLRVIFEDVQIEVATGTYVLAGSTFA